MEVVVLWVVVCGGIIGGFMVIKETAVRKTFAFLVVCATISSERGWLEMYPYGYLPLTG